MEAWLPAFIVGLVFSVIGYLLASKDKKQSEDVEKLYGLCHKLKDDMSTFQLKVAENHYPKNELDKRFDQLTHTITVGFSELSREVREMNKIMHDHFTDHHGQ